MRYSLLAYNKDKDIYDGIMGSDNKEELETLAGELVFKLHNEELKIKAEKFMTGLSYGTKRTIME